MAKFEFNQQGEVILKTCTNKACSSGGALLPVENFHKDSAAKYELTCRCAECLYKVTAAWQIQNAEYVSAWKKQWRAENPQYKTVNDTWYQNNKEKKNTRQAKRQSERYQEDICFKLAHLARTRLRSAIKNSQKKGSAIKDLGCTVLELKAHIETMFHDGMTWENHGKGIGTWQIDHIIPLGLCDLENRGQFLKAVHYSNLAPVWFHTHVTKTAVDRQNMRQNKIEKIG